MVTLHRPSNVDDESDLRNAAETCRLVSELVPIVLPLHPPHAAPAQEHGMSFGGRVSAIDPLGYLDFLALVDGSRLVLTDSGGIQEETSLLGVPCLTLRGNTERPVTVSLGTNRVVGTDPVRVRNAAVEALTRSRMPAQIPLWDGATAERIRDVLLERRDARFLPRRKYPEGGEGASGRTRSGRTPTFVRAWTSQPLAASQSCQLTPLCDHRGASEDDHPSSDP